MTDYEALIKAVLDTSGVQKEIDALQNQKITMTLDLRTGNVSVDNFLKNLQTQVKSAGQQAGNTFTNAFGGGLKTWSNNNAHTMQELQRTLAGFKFQTSDINKVTQDLEHMNLEISKVTTKIDNNNLRVTVSGIDELGRAVNIVKEFDHASGELSTVGKVISQTFETSADAAKNAKKEIGDAFSEMMRLSKEIGSLERQIWKDSNSGGNSESIKTAERQLKELEAEYAKLGQMFQGQFSTQQLDKLNQQFKENTMALEQLDAKITDSNAKLADTSAIKQRETALNELISLQQKIGSTKIELIKADASGETQKAAGLREQLEKLIDDFNRLKDASKGSFSTSDWDALSNEIARTEDKVKNLTNSLQDKINLKISTDDMRTQIDGIKGKFDELSNTAKKIDLKVDTSKLVNDLKELDDIQNKIANGNLSVEEKVAAYARYDDVIKRVGSSMKEYQKAVDDAAKMSDKMNLTITKSETLSHNMSAWLSQNKKAAVEYGQAIADLQKKLSDNPGDAKTYQEVAAQFRNIQAQAKAAGLTVGDFGNKIANTAKQLLGLTSAFAVFQKVKQIFKEMYQSVVEIDTAMTNLYKVTDETAAKYSQFLQNAKQDAQDLGRTVSDMIEQTATWAKLGYNIDDARNLSKVSSVYANVGEISNETAVSDMVTAMKAFKIEAKDAVTIVDPLNELGNKFATSAGDLGAGLSKSASTLQLAGATMNETLAMLTGGAEITQNAQEFGNAIKVGAMRVLHTSIAPVFGDRYRKPCELLKNLA